MKKIKIKKSSLFLTLPKKEREEIIKKAGDYAYKKQMEVIREYEKSTGKKVDFITC